MRSIYKVFASILMIGMMFMLQACPPKKTTISSNNFGFKAVNLTVDDGKLTATGGSPGTVNWTVNVIINGETTTISGTNKSNELPVMAGDEIEIQFTPSCPEQTEAYFTMPDGTSYKATSNDPSFTWTVPDNFSAGMQIKGETHYETDDYIYISTGVITLVELK